MTIHVGSSPIETTPEGLGRFFHRVKTYLRQSAQLCNNLVRGSADKIEIANRICSIGATSKFDGLEPEYYWLGRARIEMEKPLTLMNEYEYSLHYHWVHIANRFHEQLNELTPTDPKNFDLNASIEIAKISKEEGLENNALESVFQALKAELGAAQRLLRGWHTGADTNSAIPQAVAQAPATEDERRGKVDELTIIKGKNGDSATIILKGKQFAVDDGTANAFQAMKDAKGRPIGLAGKHVRRSGDWYKDLGKKHSELAAIVKRDGNKGYYLTIFDRA